MKSSLWYTEWMENKYELEQIIKPLTEWYEKNRRSLPWREQKNPYYIWVSEIMLQQTRVEAVKPYFERFIKALPDVEAVAACDEDRLLKLWEGLGYYNRVRNIQKAARIIMEEYQGELPSDYDSLLTLPGIGEYTAGAIASIAFDIPVPAVDGNVMRVISRLIENEEDILKQSVKRKIQRALLAIMDKTDPGLFNQSLMELGATVCMPSGQPKCAVCPLQNLCLARTHDRLDEIPLRKKNAKRKVQEKTILIIQDGEHVAIRQRPPGGLLAGLYELPNFEGHLTKQQVLDQVKQYEVEPLRIRQLPDSRHIFSHVEWNMIGYIVQITSLEEKKKKELLFVDIKNAEENYPVPAAFGTYASYLNMKLGQEKYNKGE